MSGPLLVTCAVDDAERAAQLARGLVDARLAACVQVLGPISSTYRWQGAVETAQEWLLLAKTTTERYPELQAWLVAHHPYDVPEVLAVRVSDGLPAYLSWLADQVG